MDTLRCELQQKNQDGMKIYQPKTHFYIYFAFILILFFFVASLSTIGTICDFILNLVVFQQSVTNSESAEVLSKKALCTIAHFWKPYFATVSIKNSCYIWTNTDFCLCKKIVLCADDGLLPNIKDPELLQSLLSSIVALTYVNNVKNDPTFEEKAFICQDHYPGFIEYQLGFNECLSHSDQRFSSRVSPDGMAVLSQISRSITHTLLELQPNHTPFILQDSDILFEVI